MTKERAAKVRSKLYLICALLAFRTLVLKREHRPLWPSFHRPSSDDLYFVWHWLTVGNNATAVQALTAILGVVGLAFYTLYTRTQKNLSLAQERANITPVLAVKAQDEPDGYSFTAINLGRAVAFDVAFRLEVSELPSGEKWRDGVIDETEHFPFFLPNGQGNATLRVAKRNVTREFKVLLQYTDVAERKHHVSVYGGTSTLDNNVLMMPAVRSTTVQGESKGTPLRESPCFAEPLVLPEGKPALA